MSNQEDLDNNSPFDSPSTLFVDSECTIPGTDGEISDSSTNLSTSSTISVFTDPEGEIKEAELPVGWVKQYSRSKQRDYWFNTETGQSSWTFPTQ